MHVNVYCYVCLKKGKEEDPESYGLRLHLTWKIMEQDLMEGISRHMKDRKMIRNKQH